MNKETLSKLLQMETTPEALNNSRAYLRDHLRGFLQPNKKILVCFPNTGEDSVGSLMGSVVRELGAEPIFWGPDFRWKTLLRLAFDSRAVTVMGPPLVVFGLMKLAKATATPLNIHNALIGGYPFASWIIDGIKRGLDCRIWGCYLIDDGPVVAGITCDKEAGIHIRDSLFEACISDETGGKMADAQRGYLTLRYRLADEIVFDSEETAKIWHQPCSCGCDDPRIVETVYVGSEDPAKRVLEERFLAWTSILDYRVRLSESGLELELVVFPGEPIPRIPNCAKLTVRSWNPEEDMPFCMENTEKFRKMRRKNIDISSCFV